MYTNENGYTSGRTLPKPVVCRGIRGAITVEKNDADEILEATRELLAAIVRLNDLHPDDVASVYFTTTKDLNATYPATAARQLGWYDSALLCGHEMDVPDGLPMCIRVLIHWNTTRSAQDIAHVYMRDAVSLRPDRKERHLVRPIQVTMIEAAMKVLGSRV
jgi:chorismate mutase